MAGMEYRYWTIAEARAALPKVRALMDRVMAAREEILRVQPELWPVVQKAATNGGAPAVARAVGAAETFETSVRAILAMGILVKDLNAGLLDFPHLREGREVYLCWKHGEDELRWWHEVDAGFAGRRRLEE